MPYRPLLRYKASFVKSEYFEPQFCSYGLSTTVLMTIFLSLVGVFLTQDYKPALVDKLLFIFSHTFIPP